MQHCYISDSNTGISLLGRWPSDGNFQTGNHSCWRFDVMSIVQLNMNRADYRIDRI
ncbi:hypothetical protein [Coprobacter sp.]